MSDTVCVECPDCGRFTYAGTAFFWIRSVTCFCGHAWEARGPLRVVMRDG